MQMRKPSRVFLGLILLVTLPCWGTPNFPSATQSHLKLSYQPDCSICHTHGAAENGTVTTPFGLSMRMRGLRAYDVASLDTALDALAAEKTDSNGDGIPDIQEIIDGKSPNEVTAGIGAGAPPVQYGCSSSPEVFGGHPLSKWFVLMTLAVWMRLKRVAPCRSSAS